MVEVEIKFPSPDGTVLERRLREFGAGLVIEREEVDQYYNASDRDFAQTDEALRVRQIDSQAYVTYKGPRRDLQTKTRTEIEVPLASGPENASLLGSLLTHLGYRPVARVAKRRRVYGLETGGLHAEVCLDEVEGVGSYVEVEILADEEEVNRARTALLDLAGKLGLEGSERRSYLQLLLERQGKQ